MSPSTLGHDPGAIEQHVVAIAIGRLGHQLDPLLAVRRNGLQGAECGDRQQGLAGADPWAQSDGDGHQSLIRMGIQQQVGGPLAIGKLLVVDAWQATVERLLQLRAVEGAVVLPELQVVGLSPRSRQEAAGSGGSGGDAMQQGHAAGKSDTSECAQSCRYCHPLFGGE